MFSLAASIGFAILANGAQIGRLTEREQAVWHRMEPSVATLLVGDQPVGAAALIDDTGLFVASRGAVQVDSMQARLSSGTKLRLTVISRSGSTGLVLLKADKWQSGQVKPFDAPMGTERPSGTLLAVLGTGPIRAQFVSEKTLGVLPKSRRPVPLAEIRFEAPAEMIGSALILCEDGELVGALNATLRRQDSGSQNTQGLNLRNQGLPPAVTRNLPGYSQQQANSFGPAEMTVAYTVGRAVVRQVIDGFLSPDHEAAFPSLGVFCKDNVGGGALVEVVQPNSPAQKAGIHVGDVILDIAGNQIRDQVDFGQAMLKQQIGSKISIRTNRGGLVQVRDVVIGKVLDQETV